MFVYYEVFDEGKPSQVYEVILSSDGRSPVINWKNKDEKMAQQLIVSIIQQIPLENRLTDDKTHITTLIGDSGKVLIEGLTGFVIAKLLKQVEIKKIKDLTPKAACSRLHYEELNPPAQSERLKYKEEDFFYSAPSDNGPSGQVLLQRLAPLLAITPEDLSKQNDDKALKRLYRAAALKYHPDRNNGDGSRMSELNMLWNIFMQQGA